MAIGVKCASCGHTFRVDDNYAGKKGKCKQCGAVVTVPGVASAASSPARPAGTSTKKSAPAANKVAPADGFAGGQTEWDRLLGSVEDSGTGPDVVAAPQYAAAPPLPPVRQAPSRGAPPHSQNHNTAFNPSAGGPPGYGASRAPQATGDSKVFGIFINALCIIMPLCCAAAAAFAFLRIEVLAWLFVALSMLIVLPSVFGAQIWLARIAGQEDVWNGLVALLSLRFAFRYAKANPEGTEDIRKIWISAVISSAIVLLAIYLLEHPPGTP